MRLLDEKNLKCGFISFETTFFLRIHQNIVLVILHHIPTWLLKDMFSTLDTLHYLQYTNKVSGFKNKKYFTYTYSFFKLTN